MTMYVRIQVNADEPFATAVITNCGHPDTELHPADDDLRVYEYHLMRIGARADDCPTGEVQHHRNEGPWELLRKVLNDAH